MLAAAAFASRAQPRVSYVHAYLSNKLLAQSFVEGVAGWQAGRLGGHEAWLPNHHDYYDYYYYDDDDDDDYYYCPRPLLAATSLLAHGECSIPSFDRVEAACGRVCVRGERMEKRRVAPSERERGQECGRALYQIEGLTQTHAHTRTHTHTHTHTHTRTARGRARGLVSCGPFVPR
jgi:hypothetical protein